MGEKNHCSYNLCNYTMEIALCNVTVFGSESVLLLPGVTAALWETVDRPALALLCGLCDALDRQIPASVNANGLNTSVWSYFHYVFFHQQSFAPSFTSLTFILCFHIHQFELCTCCHPLMKLSRILVHNTLISGDGLV